MYIYIYPLFWGNGPACSFGNLQGGAQAFEHLRTLSVLFSSPVSKGHALPLLRDTIFETWAIPISRVTCGVLVPVAATTGITAYANIT